MCVLLQQGDVPSHVMMCEWGVIHVMMRDWGVIHVMMRVLLGCDSCACSLYTLSILIRTVTGSPYVLSTTGPY